MLRRSVCATSGPRPSTGAPVLLCAPRRLQSATTAAAAVTAAGNDIPELSAEAPAVSAGGPSAAEALAVAAWVAQGNFLPAEQTARVAQAAGQLLGEEPNVVRVALAPGSRVTVVGDLHGQLADLRRALEEVGDLRFTHAVFTGDYVDRGPNSVEVALALLALKVAHPGHVHLGRGNHESVRISSRYGFMEEVLRKYGQHGLGTYIEFMRAFMRLPLAHVLGDRVYAVHGGISARTAGGAYSLDELDAVDRFCEPEKSAELMMDSLWADPQEEEGTSPSDRGGASLKFGPDVTKKFLDKNGLGLIVRSHQPKKEGYEVQQGGRLVTVFSASNYCEGSDWHNKGAVARFVAPEMRPEFVQYSVSSLVPRLSPSL